MAYIRLIFTDITIRENVVAVDGNGNKCRLCGITERADMNHCIDCGTCSELYDHHCGVIGVCICGKNYKYFVLFITYGGASIMAIATGFGSLISNCNNSVLKSYLEEIYGPW